MQAKINYHFTFFSITLQCKLIQLQFQIVENSEVFA